MPEDEPHLVPLLEAIRAVLAWLESEHVSGVLIGGVAASILGRPRLTNDIDALVVLDEDLWPAFLASCAAFGLAPRRVDALAFAKRARVLLLVHRTSGIGVDVSLGALPFEEEVVKRATRAATLGLLLPPPTPEDLIILKAVAHRPKDLEDISSVLDAHPRLDSRRVRRWTRAFAEALDAPEIAAGVEALLARRGRARGGAQPRRRDRER